MTIEQINARLEKIRGLDDEEAHCEQDKLYEEVLGAIASGKCEDTPAKLADAVLKVREIEFERWYA